MCIDQRKTLEQRCPFSLISDSSSQGKILCLGGLSWHGHDCRRYDYQGRYGGCRASCEQAGCMTERLCAVTRFSFLMFSISSYINLRPLSQNLPLRLLAQNWSLLLTDLFTHTLETEANLFSENYLYNRIS